MTSFERVMRDAGDVIMDMSGVVIKIPNMQNGRCFVSSKELSDATLEEVKAQVLVRRSETGVPILQCGKVDRARHDLELKLAQDAAETIIEKLAGVPDSDGTCQRLRFGHVLVEEDVELISRIMNFRLNVACADDTGRPFYEVSSGDPESKGLRKTYSFSLSSQNLEVGRQGSLLAHHWEAIRRVPSGQLLGVCREVLQLKFKVPHCTDRVIHELKREVGTLKRKFITSKRTCRNLVARVEVLERQQTDLKGCLDNHQPPPEQPRTPTPPPSAFVLWRSSIKGELVAGVGGNAVLGNEEAKRRWHALSAEQKQPFKEEAELRRAAYQAAYHAYVALIRDTLFTRRPHSGR